MQNIYEIYPKMSPTSTKILPFQCRKSRINRETSMQRMTDSNRSASSLVQHYNHLCKKESLTTMSPPPLPQANHKHSFSYMQANMEQKMGKNQHVQKAINSMNIYSEQIRSAIIGQQKSKGKLSHLTMNNRKERVSHRSLVNEPQQNPETLVLKNSLITKYSNKNMAFKTINLLYKAIIDSSLQRKKRDDFELTANKLPIIDRFQITRRMSKFKDRSEERSCTLEPLELRNTKMNTLYKNTQMKFKSKEEKAELKTPREDIDIIPWSFEEEQNPIIK